MPSPRQIFHIDLDAFFVSVEQALNPALRGRPVVVGGSPRSRGVVACASYEARAYGLKAGMPTTKAYRLCPHATFLEGRFSRYLEASERFLGILGDFTPDVEPVGIDEAFLDMSGFEPLYGPTMETALRIKRRIRDELGITASVGIATSKVIAKVASDLCKPDGLLEVPPGKERDFLSPLPVSKLPYVGPRTEAVLKSVRIATIGDLAAIPETKARRLFGATGELLHRYANGIDERGLMWPPAPVKSISRATTFAEDTFDQRLLRATLRYLTERVASELRKEGKEARCITLKLRYDDFKTITRNRALKGTTNAEQVIFDVGEKLLVKALKERPRQVRLIGIGVSSLEMGGQLDMLDTSSERLSMLNRTVDSVREKHGFTAIQTGLTLFLRGFFSSDQSDYILKTPAISR